MQHLLGALKPKTDLRDYKVAASAANYPNIYLCGNTPPVKNQGSVSSCVAHATAAILETLNKTETGEFTKLSTNFIYGMQGVAYGRMEGGMYLRDACKIVKDYGDATADSVGGNTEQPKCTEELQTTLNTEVYSEAQIFKIKSYARCNSVEDIKYALMNYGPVLASIKWYNSYNMKDKMIQFNKKSNAGYHAIMICGWDEEGWICQNSWGKHWNGDGTFRYSYEEPLAEAWSFVDAENSDIYKPKRNSFFDIIYKITNSIINFFKSLRS